ncbi:MAG: hypothetical protein IPL39_05550 [Opitutaceae bacterium]|nr:hypothetical protein [Opitutaceae bacterium]
MKEEGGKNLYGMVGNNVIDRFDLFGLIRYDDSGPKFGIYWNNRENHSQPNDGPFLTDRVLEFAITKPFVRCYFLDLTDKAIVEIIRVLEGEIMLLDSEVVREYFRGLPQSGALKFLAINAAARKFAASIPQGRPGPFGIPTAQSAAARYLNRKELLKPLRNQTARLSLKAVGRGGVKIWGRVGSKVLPFVGWFSAGYDTAKACHCADVTRDGDSNNNEKFVGQ